MIKSPTRAHRQLISPKFSSKHPDNVSKLGNVEGEYQLRSNKNAKKIQNNGNKRIQKESQKEQQKSVIGRKLSFKRIVTEQSYIQSRPKRKISLLRQNGTGKISQLKTKEELALEIEYNQFRPQNAEVLSPMNPTLDCSGLKRRIKRIKSSDQFSLKKVGLPSCQDFDTKIKFAKEENSRLKQLRTQTLIRLTDVQKTYNEEKQQFLGEVISCQRQMQALKRRISRNKSELGHIFTYQQFDRLKMVVRPIVEMDGESSLMRSALKTTEYQFQQLQSQSRLRSNQLKESDGREKLTQTTGPASRQQYGQLDYF